jgi:hypothetical protein
MRVYVVRKWPLQGRSHFVCWNITRVSLCKQKSSGCPLTTEDDVEQVWASFLQCEEINGNCIQGAISIENNSVEGSASAFGVFLL